MTIEAAAGKNPMSHPGKIYSIVAQQVATSIAADLKVENAECVLVSQIGRPINDPQIADISLSLPNAETAGTSVRQVTEIVYWHLSRLNSLRDALLAGEIMLY